MKYSKTLLFGEKSATIICHRNGLNLVLSILLSLLVYLPTGTRELLTLRPHSKECSGGDLDGDLFLVCWDENLIPLQIDAPMDYFPWRPHIMDHNVTSDEIQKSFVDYMINDNLRVIATAHLIHVDREIGKARSPKCLQLATLHSMAIDFAKDGAPVEMPRVLKPKEYPDFMERGERNTYESSGILGELYCAVMVSTKNELPDFIWSEEVAEAAYDQVIPAFEEAITGMALGVIRRLVAELIDDEFDLAGQIRGGRRSYDE